MELDKIYNMDCLEGMKQIPDGTIDLIVTDPPYEFVGNNEKYGGRGAFRCINEHWQREQRLARYKKHPVIHIKREFQVTMQNFDKIDKLSKEGVVLMWSCDVSRDPTISVTLKDGHTTVETNGWLMQDTEGGWWGMDNGYHRMLEEYQKIIIER